MAKKTTAHENDIRIRVITRLSCPGPSHRHRQVEPVVVEFASTVEGVTPSKIPIQLLRGADRFGKRQQ